MDREKLKLDRMRYVKDSTPSLFAIAAIVFDVLYFVLIYKINNEYFYTFMIAVSIIANLLFMLFGFWCSIEVKNYHGKFGYLMIFLGIVQIVRMFIFPMQAHSAKVLIGEELRIVMTTAQFTRSLVYLGISAAFMIAGGVLSILHSKTLMNHLKSLEGK